jgi:transcriptional regulator with XRE-family HTH domain
MKVWKNIRAAREAAKMSPADLAKKIHVEQMRIDQYESGDLEPTMEIIIAIADALKIAPRDLLNLK